MEIILITLIFIALLLFIVWLPFFRTSTTKIDNNGQHNLREETNIVLYKEHKAEIEKDYTDGAIDEESYQYLLAELDNSLLQDIATDKEKPKSPKTIKNLSVVWPILLSCFIVAFSVALYLKQGTLDALMATPIASHSDQQSEQSPEQEQAKLIAYISSLQKHLVDEPDDSEAWYNLGQTFVGAGEFDLAITAFKQVIRIEGEHADLLGVIAQATYYLNNQKIDEPLQMLIDKALALDANDPSTNILLGMHNFTAQNYTKAIDYWQGIIDEKRPSVNVAALQAAVNEAKKRLVTPLKQAELTTNPDTAVGPKLTLNVSLSEEISQKLAQGEDKIVFVYAIPTSGQRMPLAALKLMASDLPKILTLSDSNAMSAQSNLSSVGEVNILAIVSDQGGAGIKPGDFKAEARNIAVNKTETINLVIDHIVK